MALNSSEERMVWTLFRARNPRMDDCTLASSVVDAFRDGVPRKDTLYTEYKPFETFGR